MKAFFYGAWDKRELEELTSWEEWIEDTGFNKCSSGLSLWLVFTVAKKFKTEMEFKAFHLLLVIFAC